MLAPPLAPSTPLPRTPTPGPSETTKWTTTTTANTPRPPIFPFSLQTCPRSSSISVFLIYVLRREGSVLVNGICSGIASEWEMDVQQQRLISSLWLPLKLQAIKRMLFWNFKKVKECSWNAIMYILALSIEPNFKKMHIGTSWNWCKMAESKGSRAWCSSIALVCGEGRWFKTCSGQWLENSS